jgi:type IV pilus assembly protein PilM
MIGLDISDRSVKIVQLSQSEPRRLLAHCWHAIPEGVIEHGLIRERSKLQQVLKEALQLCQMTSRADDAVVASIPEMQSFLRIVELPAMADDEMHEAVRWEVARHIPFGLENVYIDWQPVEAGHTPSAGQREVLVGAAQRKVVDPLLGVFRALGINVVALELESQAIVRALISNELRSHQGLLLVDLGGTVTNVVIHDHGAMRFTASLQRGANSLATVLPAGSARLLEGPRQDELPAEDQRRIAEGLRAGQEELVMEVLGIVEFYNGIDANHEVKEILLTGGGSNLPGLDNVFLRYFENVHVQRGNPWVNILATGWKKRPPLSLRESVHFTTALGLALRQVDL